MSTFQLFVILIFGFIGVFAVLLFSGLLGNPGGASQLGEVVIWGTAPADALNQVFDVTNQQGANDFRITYVEKPEATFESDLVSALASGKGPDLMFMPESFLVRHADKLSPMPPSMLSQRQFLDTYVPEGQMFLTSQGALGLPIYLDPMVMYWNRDLFTAAQIAEPPKYWEQFESLAQTLTKHDELGTITQSAVGLGGVRNITHEKDILATLFLQADDPVVGRTDAGRYVVTLGQGSGVGTTETPAAAAVRFYREFADPLKTSYAWSSALPASRDAFAQGILAVYFGRASEAQDIAKKNPHLNFDVALMPQRQGAPTPATYGNLFAIAALNASPKRDGALRVEQFLTDPQITKALSDSLKLPAARRDVLAMGTQDPALDVFERSALISRGWYDPNPSATERVFLDMLDAVATGNADPLSAVSDASKQLDTLLNK